MPRPKKPLALAKLDGSALKNPQRYRGNEPAGTESLGDPPSYLPEAARKAWRIYQVEIPWLRMADSANLEIASLIRADILAGEQVGIQRLQLLRQLNNTFGKPPALAGDGEPEDEFESAFFGEK
ncbi:hypothetical protein [Rhizobium sp. BR 315]|uniref:hypothetical protein n=1 Tax=Rhizobium sp. BR 315 TaxID=3040014 RepID=UPI003D333445